jgi:hypothetical protein
MASSDVASDISQALPHARGSDAEVEGRGEQVRAAVQRRAVRTERHDVRRRREQALRSVAALGHQSAGTSIVFLVNYWKQCKLQVPCSINFDAIPFLQDITFSLITHTRVLKSGASSRVAACTAPPVAPARAAAVRCRAATPSVSVRTRRQGLTLVHFSAQPEPFSTQNTP